MKTQDIAYAADGADMIGYLAVDDSHGARRPGVLVCHEGPGLTDHTRSIARRLAELGYCAFAMDYHGGGQPLVDMSQVMGRIGAWRADPTGIRARAHAALAVLTAQPETDPDRLAGIGYCFGGTTVLEMARAGEPLKAVVGFHSGLGTGRPAAPGTVKAIVLTQIGRDDPIIPADERLAFEQEMTDAGVDWRMTVFGGAGHSFTNPLAGSRGMKGFEYNEAADRRSWRAMLDLFDEALGPVTPGAPSAA